MILSDVLTVLSLPCASSCPYKNTLFLQNSARARLRAKMEPYGLGAGGLLIEQGEPVMVSVNKSELRLGLALWPELPDRAVVRLVHPGSASAGAGLCCFDVTGRHSNNLGPHHRPGTADR